MSNAITTTTTTTTTINASTLLTRKQNAILSNLNSLDRKGLTLVALAGRGQAAKLSAGVVADLEMVDALASFERSGCTNVRPFAVLVNSITGQFIDGKTLNPAPTRKVDFLAYDSQVYAWASQTENEKTRASRLAVYDYVADVVQAVRQASAAAHAARLAAAEQSAMTAAHAARLAAAEQSAMTAEQSEVAAAEQSAMTAEQSEVAAMLVNGLITQGEADALLTA